MNNRERLTSVFKTVLEVDDTDKIQSLEYNTIPKWDSVGHMQLIAAIETEFDILMETEQIIDMNCFDIACSILGDHGIDCSS